MYFLGNGSTNCVPFGLERRSLAVLSEGTGGRAQSGQCSQDREAAAPATKAAAPVKPSRPSGGRRGLFQSPDGGVPARCDCWGRWPRGVGQKKSLWLISDFLVTGLAVAAGRVPGAPR